MPEDLQPALDALRPLLLDVDTLVRAVGAGRRRNARTSFARVELRPVDLKAGRRLQVVTTPAEPPAAPLTRNLAPGPEAQDAVDALLAEPLATWYVETADRTVQLRVTKKGEAQVHSARASRRDREPSPAAHDRPRNHLLDAADPLFAALGADADKRRQVDAFLRQLAAAVPRALATATRAGRPLHVVDLGCGNAYLTFAAHRYLAGRDDVPHGVRTVGIDVRPDMVERNRRLAEELGLDGLSFSAGAIEDADPGLPGGVDVVLALHACDTATDDALARAVRWQAPTVLAAPCCHHDVQRQLAEASAAGERPPGPYVALTRDAILRERFTDVLTDALRADVLRLLGYSVDVVEFVDSRHTPRNALLRAERTGPGRGPAVAGEYEELTSAWHVRPALAERLAPELSAALGGAPEPAAAG